MTANTNDNRNDSEWIKQSVIEQAREVGLPVGSGAWLARPVEGQDRIDVYRFAHSVDRTHPRGKPEMSDVETETETDRDEHQLKQGELAVCDGCRRARPIKTHVQEMFGSRVGFGPGGDTDMFAEIDDIVLCFSCMEDEMTENDD